METTVKCECGRDVPINPPQINADLMLICDHQAAEVERLQAENDDYRKWYDGEGSKSPETLLAKSRADCVKLRAALDLSEEYNQQKDGELI